MGVMVGFSHFQSIDFGLNQNQGVTFPRARVIEVLYDGTEIDTTGIRMGRQDLLVEITSGAYRGEIVNVQNLLFLGQSVYAEAGSRVILYFERVEGEMDYFARIQSYERMFGIYFLVSVFIGLLGAVFGKAGLRSAFSLVFSFVVIIFFLIPAIVAGGPPAMLTVFSSLLIVTVSLISITGFERKTLVSLLGTVIGIVCYIVFYHWMSWVLSISGFNVQQMSTIIVIGFNTPVGISQLLFSGILIASLGAIMDVAVSLSSVISELSASKANTAFKGLFKAGMAVGKDMIGSSSNTLILAFAGTFFISLIIFRTNSLSVDMIINSADIGIEVLRSLSASSAMVLTAPATAAIGAYIYSKK